MSHTPKPKCGLGSAAHPNPSAPSYRRLTRRAKHIVAVCDRINHEDLPVAAFAPTISIDNDNYDDDRTTTPGRGFTPDLDCTQFSTEAIAANLVD